MNTAGADSTIVQEITIKGTAARIFEALTSPTQRIQWWRSAGRFEITEVESDLRPGGKWIMHGKGLGRDSVTVRGEYRRIDPPRVLEFTWQPDWQEDSTVSTVRFDLEEKDGVTNVRLTHSGLVTEASRNSHRGWPHVLTLLQDYIQQAG